MRQIKSAPDEQGAIHSRLDGDDNVSGLSIARHPLDTTTRHVLRALLERGEQGLNTHEARELPNQDTCLLTTVCVLRTRGLLIIGDSVPQNHRGRTSYFTRFRLTDPGSVALAKRLLDGVGITEAGGEHE